MKKILVALMAMLLLVCGFALAEEACEHDLHVTSATVATCTEASTQTEYCTKCSYKDTWTVSPALGHAWDGGVTTEGNCQTPSVTVTTCTRCGATEKVTGSVGVHDLKIDVKAASCKAPKTYIETCNVCGYENDRWTEGSALDHDLKIDVIPASCQNAETFIEKCTLCGYKNDEWYGEPALPHNKATNVAGYPATCEEDGLTDGAKCSMCGTTTVDQKVIPALGHDYVKRVVKPTETKRGYTEWSCTRCDFYSRSNYTDKLVAETEIVVDVALNPYGSIVTDLEDNEKPYTAEVDEETGVVTIIAKDENGAYPLRELHLALALIAEWAEDGIVEVDFVVGDAVITVPFASFEGEIMQVAKDSFPEELTGYIITLDPNAVNAEGVEGCLVKVDMTADLGDVDGIEMEITDVMTGMTLVLEDAPITITGGGVYVAA